MKSVFVVGAGPAGLFAAQKIALAGHPVVVFNRDIKPGGLAEYGIYPVKDKMRFGLRKQFAKVLSLPNLHYFGHVTIGNGYDLSLDDLRAMNPSAVIVSCGAHGRNRLGLPGENAKGTYSAKDFVYHYNQLPPYASMDFSTGRSVAVVGMGNVAVDILRWLMIDNPERRTEQVVVIARRGPFEAKFDEKEIAHVERHLSRPDFLQELERIRERCAACNQDVSPAKVAEATFPFLKKSDPTTIPPKLTFRFLSSPKEIIAGPDGRICKLVVTENLLARKADGSTVALPTESTAVLDVDTMIFAIGDKHDPNLGLPMGPAGYAIRPAADPDETAYEAFDPARGQVMEGFYLVGWARRPNAGLVGIARHDGEVGAAKVLEYLKTLPERPACSAAEIQAGLESRGLRVVTKSDLELLSRAEAREAQKRGLTHFKFADNESMLQAMAREKARDRNLRENEEMRQTAV